MSTEPNEFEEMIRRLRETMGRMQEQGTSNPLLDLLSSFLSFFLNIDDDSDAPDFDAIIDPTERAAAEQAYRGRESAERARHGDFRESARRWTAVDVAASSAELLEMRRTLEAANGGEPLRAIHPVEGESRRTSNFGMRTHPISGRERLHAGTDFAGKNPGDKPNILAAMPGIVVGVGVRGGYGNTVEILDIYGVRHRYAHLDSSSVRVGQQIGQGDRIGVMGTTGHSTAEHLHYEQRDASDNPRDPAPHIDAHRHPARPANAPGPAPAARPKDEADAPSRNPFPQVNLPPGLVRVAAQAQEVTDDLSENANRLLGGLQRSVVAGLGRLPFGNK